MVRKREMSTHLREHCAKYCPNPAPYLPTLASALEGKRTILQGVTLRAFLRLTQGDTAFCPIYNPGNLCYHAIERKVRRDRRDTGESSRGIP